MEIKEQMIKQYGRTPDVIPSGEKKYVEAGFVNFLLDELDSAYDAVKRIKWLCEYDKVSKEVLDAANTGSVVHDT